eukprot:scaffold143807_cov36-Prasinocladus_malaysianus.AAC.1
MCACLESVGCPVDWPDCAAELQAGIETEDVQLLAPGLEGIHKASDGVHRSQVALCIGPERHKKSDTLISMIAAVCIIGGLSCMAFTF